jgi:hypothetical protein
MGTVLLSGNELGEAPLIRLRRVVSDTVVASGPAQGAAGASGISGPAAGTVAVSHAVWIELASFQWGVGRGVTELASFQWGVGRAAAEASPTGGSILAGRPIEIVSFNF